MKTVQEFIANQFKIPKSTAQAGISDNLKEHLYSLIVCSDFRRTAVDINSVTDIQNKINQQVSEGQPIGFSIPFGAYKNWRLQSYADPDWAEVFNINYLIRYATPIAASYSPGVIIQYSFTDEVWI